MLLGIYDFIKTVPFDIIGEIVSISVPCYKANK